MEWNEEAIGQLRTLWAEGHSTAEIGRRMGVSKNAVVGKAHRLGLVSRPSPIRRDVSADAAARPPVPRRVSGPTLPPLQAATPSPVPALPVPAPLPAAAPRAVVRPALQAVPARGARRSACCWPIGEPGTPSFHFCDADARAGKPYCADHAQLAYVKVRDRREEAA
ncbi:MAG TPA: GcrA family cell cycle regulator [Acetobacteraceae bacterium]|nr:GcrA family cell cycle regulator [Acetobacteraceae bacterium]